MKENKKRKHFSIENKNNFKKIKNDEILEEEIKDNENFEDNVEYNKNIDLKQFLQFINSDNEEKNYQGDKKIVFFFFFKKIF